MPPRVTKQAPVPTAPPLGNGVLSRIGPIKQSIIGRLKFSVYGNPKTGKTRFAATFPKPMLLIGAEDGTASVIGVEGLEFVQLQRTEELWEIIDGPLKAGRYASVGIDTATKLRDMRIGEILGLSKPLLQKSFGLVNRDVYTRAAGDMKQMLAPLLDLPRQLEINVVIIAQEANLVGDDNATSTDLIKPKYGSAVGKSVADYINAECDYIAQTLIKEEIVMKEITVGKAIQKVPERTGKKEYCIRVGPHEIYQTGFRMPMGREVDLPEFIVNPTYDKIAELLKPR